MAYLEEEEEAVSVTQKRFRAVGSVSADPQREDEISAPTEADNVPLVARRKCFSVVLGVVSPSQLFGNVEQVNYSSFPSGTKCGQNP